MKLLISGSSGLLGRQVVDLLARDYPDIKYATPTRREMDVTKMGSVTLWRNRIEPDVVLHLAAFTGVARSEKNHWRAYMTNVLGSRNMATINSKIVYVSTDYVFSGEKGYYQELDHPRPINFYGWTKLMGEYMVRLSGRDYLIIRTSFCEDDIWPHPRAFADQWTSREPVSWIAPRIVWAALHLEGIIHIGGVRKTVYELARSIDPNVLPCLRSDVKKVNLPRDTSLNTLKWDSLYET